MFYLHWSHEVSDLSAAVENQVDTHENRELIETVVQCTVVNIHNHNFSTKMYVSWRGNKHKIHDTTTAHHSTSGSQINRNVSMECV